MFLIGNFNLFSLPVSALGATIRTFAKRLQLSNDSGSDIIINSPFLHKFMINSLGEVFVQTYTKETFKKIRHHQDMQLLLYSFLKQIKAQILNPESYKMLKDSGCSGMLKPFLHNIDNFLSLVISDCDKEGHFMPCDNTMSKIIKIKRIVGELALKLVRKS